jgi:hypothetical protein
LDYVVDSVGAINVANMLHLPLQHDIINYRVETAAQPSGVRRFCFGEGLGGTAEAVPFPIRTFI